MAWLTGERKLEPLEAVVRDIGKMGFVDNLTPKQAMEMVIDHSKCTQKFGSEAPRVLPELQAIEGRLRQTFHHEPASVTPQSSSNGAAPPDHSSKDLPASIEVPANANTPPVEPAPDVAPPSPPSSPSVPPVEVPELTSRNWTEWTQPMAAVFVTKIKEARAVRSKTRRVGAEAEVCKTLGVPAWAIASLEKKATELPPVPVAAPLVKAAPVKKQESPPASKPAPVITAAPKSAAVVTKPPTSSVIAPPPPIKTYNVPQPKENHPIFRRDRSIKPALELKAPPAPAPVRTVVVAPPALPTEIIAEKPPATNDQFSLPKDELLHSLPTVPFIKAEERVPDSPVPDESIPSVPAIESKASVENLSGELASLRSLTGAPDAGRPELVQRICSMFVQSAHAVAREVFQSGQTRFSHKALKNKATGIMIDFASRFSGTKDEFREQLPAVVRKRLLEE